MLYKYCSNMYTVNKFIFYIFPKIINKKKFTEANAEQSNIHIWAQQKNHLKRARTIFK